MTATVATIVAASPATAAPTPRARKLAVRNEVALSHHTAVRKDLAQDSARVTAQKAHKPAVRNGVVLGTTLVNPVLARRSADSGQTISWQAERLLELQRKQPGHGPKGPQARGPRPSHGGPKGRPEPHRGHRGPRR